MKWFKISYLFHIESTDGVDINISGLEKKKVPGTGAIIIINLILKNE